MPESEPKTRFRDVICAESAKSKVLPLVHITDGYNLFDIIKPKKLTAYHCDVFDKNLIYMFYGKPAYRKRYFGTNKNSSMLPCVFIFDVNAIKDDVYAVYPFDTGAFDGGVYGDFFHRRMKLIDFSLNPNINSARQLVDYFYTSEIDYILGRSTKNLNIEAPNFEVESYYDLARHPTLFPDKSKINPDERGSAIEIQFNKDIEMKGKLLGCILPISFFENREIRETLDIIKPKYIKPYIVIENLHNMMLASTIYEKLCEILKEEGFEL
ncbi:MAG: hypothetical protein KDJ62_06265 [Rhodobiaceae bacterium]|nr:hypothetical protein [Rhodobiaceae bacterium]MCC0049591.1 hypothetical protein [Rhodobiaceae bacterium]